MNRWIRILAIVVIGAVLASCANQPLAQHGPEIPGFLYGLLHGAISPFALVASAFTDVRIYAFWDALPSSAEAVPASSSPKRPIAAAFIFAELICLE
jgi:hypothetical protein